jgi:hypothetical protein
VFRAISTAGRLVWLLVDGVANVVGGLLERKSAIRAREIVSYLMISGSILPIAFILPSCFVAFENGNRFEGYNAFLVLLTPLMMTVREWAVWAWLKLWVNPLPLDPASEEEVAEAGVCAICRDVLQHTDAGKLPCRHCFHRACITSWNKQASHCPICMGSIRW